MTEAIMTLSIFAAPLLAVGIVEQRKLENSAESVNWL